MAPPVVTFRSVPFATFVMANEVDVAFVSVELPEIFSLVAKSVTAESAVVDAYGNCEAATVDEEKKTPAVAMEVEVAAVDVPKLFDAKNGYKNPLPVWSALQPNMPLFHVRKNPAWQV